MSVAKIFIIDQGCGYYVGFGNYRGVPVSSVARMEMGCTRSEVERTLSIRFFSQITAHKNAGRNVEPVHNRTKRVFDFEWIQEPDAQALLANNLPVFEVAPVPMPNRKPKIYEVVDDGKGLRLITHEKELLDEDEAKLMLFAQSVNG